MPVQQPASGSASPQFWAPGIRGRILARGAALALRLAGFGLASLASFLPPRLYRRAERTSMRIAWRFLGMDDGVVTPAIAPRPYVVMPLHESLVDPLLLSRLPLPLTFLARDELFEWPHIGELLRVGRHFTVPNELSPAALRSLLRDARARLDTGDSLVVFPQGSVLGIEVAFQRGAFWLARELGIPILPVVITGTHRVWEHPFSPRLRRGQPVTMQVLAPIPAQEAYEDRHQIEGRMRHLALQDHHAPTRRFVPERDGYWDGYSFTIADEFPALAAAIDQRRRSRQQAPSPERVAPTT